jgi:hypothetical protein
MIVIGIMMSYLMSGTDPTNYLGHRLTDPTATAQSSHPSLLETKLLDTNLKTMTGNVTAAMIMISRIISRLRDEYGTPIQTSF